MVSSSSISSSNGAWREALLRSLPVLALTALLVVPFAIWLESRFRTLSKGSTPEHKVIERATRGESWDVVIFGSSRARYGIDPTAFRGSLPGIASRTPAPRAYNLALPGCSGRMIQFMAEYFLDRGNRTRVAVIELNPLSFDSRHLWRRPFSDVPAMDRNTALDLFDRTYGSAEPLTRLQIYVNDLPLWRDRVPPERLLLGIDWYDPIRASRTPDDATRFHLGYTPLPERRFYAQPQIKKLRSPKYNVHMEDVVALEAAIRLLMASGARVVIVETPTCLWTEAGDVFEAYLREKSRILKTPGLLHLTFRAGILPTAVDDKEGYFWDETHLSHRGAVRFSDDLWHLLRLRLAVE